MLCPGAANSMFRRLTFNKGLAETAKIDTRLSSGGERFKHLVRGPVHHDLTALDYD